MSRPRRRRTVYDPNDFRRLASMNQAAETGRPVRYGVTRDARVACMQENGTVRVGERAAPGCCVISLMVGRWVVDWLMRVERG